METEKKIELRKKFRCFQGLGTAGSDVQPQTAGQEQCVERGGQHS